MAKKNPPRISVGCGPCNEWFKTDVLDEALEWLANHVHKKDREKGESDKV